MENIHNALRHKLEGQEKFLKQNIAQHEKERKDCLSKGDKCSAAYHWGRISGLSTGITALQVVLDELEETLRDYE